MGTRTLSEERIQWILTEVKLVGETYRKPDGSDPSRWNYTAHRRCFGGAFPSDLGATKRDQTLTKDMYLMVELGYLKLCQYTYFPGFLIA